MGWLRVAEEKRERHEWSVRDLPRPLWMCVSLLGWGHPSSGPHPRHSEAPLNIVFHSNRLKHRGLQGTSHSWDAVLRWGLQGPRPAGGPSQARNGHRKARS